MKATGIVRKIDELGRVVIPKEIRNTMRIRTGDPLEIFTDHDGSVIFKKHSPIMELAEIAGKYAEATSKACGILMAVIDSDKVVACAGIPKKDILKQNISSDMENIIDSRQLYTWRNNDKKIPISDRPDKYFAKAVMPISTLGAVAIVETEAGNLSEVTDTEIKIIRAAALFFEKHLDE